MITSGRNGIIVTSSGPSSASRADMPVAELGPSAAAAENVALAAAGLVGVDAESLADVAEAAAEVGRMVMPCMRCGSCGAGDGGCCSSASCRSRLRASRTSLPSAWSQVYCAVAQTPHCTWAWSQCSPVSLTSILTLMGLSISDRCLVWLMDSKNGDERWRSMALDMAASGSMTMEQSIIFASFLPGALPDGIIEGG
jgi:hypothetical protein